MANPTIADRCRSILTDTLVYSDFLTDEIQSVLMKLLRVKTYSSLIKHLEGLAKINNALFPAMRGCWGKEVEDRLTYDVPYPTRIWKHIKNRSLDLPESTAKIVEFYRRLWSDFDKMFPPDDIQTDEVAAPTLKPFRPSNSDQGYAFTSRWCDRCEREVVKNGCSILTQSLIGQAAEWIYNEQGEPICTAWVERTTETHNGEPMEGEISHLDTREPECPGQLTLEIELPPSPQPLEIPEPGQGIYSTPWMKYRGVDMCCYSFDLKHYIGFVKSSTVELVFGSSVTEVNWAARSRIDALHRAL